MIAEHLDPMQTLWKVMEVPAERVRHRLRFMVVVEARQVAPALVAPHLDQPRAELDAEEKPAHQDDEAELRSRRDRAEEDREEPGLEEQ